MNLFFNAQMWAFYALFVTPEPWWWLGGRITTMFRR